MDLSEPSTSAKPKSHRAAWSPGRVSEANRTLKDASPAEIVKWGVQTFGEDIALATGFGPSGIVLMHMASRLEKRPKFFYLETDLLFPATYRLKEELERQFKIEILSVHSGISLDEQAEMEGPDLWKTNPDACCYLRKVMPLRKFLSGKKAWITGLRRDQSATRAETDVIEWDFANAVVKLNPLAHWTEQEIWAYVKVHDLPYNPLHDEGYPSIGCMPCTRAVSAGEDARSGRWAGTQKIECGIHNGGDFNGS